MFEKTWKMRIFQVDKFVLQPPLFKNYYNSNIWKVGQSNETTAWLKAGKRNMNL